MLYLKNDNITLRALETTDLELLYEWENNTNYWPNGSTIEPYSRFILEAFIEQADKNIFESKQMRLIIERNDTHEAIGAVDLFDFDPLHARAAVGVLVYPPHQKHGYALQALKLLTGYAFNHLHLNQLYAQVGSSNAASVSLFTRAGFIQSGILQQWLRHDHQFESAIFFQLLNPHGV